MRRIAIDAMGTDSAPVPEVEGAVQAAREGLAEVILVGPQDLLKRELSRLDAAGLPIELVHASEAVTMEETAAKSFRRKRDSSIRVAARLVREHQADGLISAGNTGAVMTTAKIVLGTLQGVARPALAAVFPTSQGKGCRVAGCGRQRGLQASTLAAIRGDG